MAHGSMSLALHGATGSMGDAADRLLRLQPHRSSCPDEAAQASFCCLTALWVAFPSERK